MVIKMGLGTVGGAIAGVALSPLIPTVGLVYLCTGGALGGAILSGTVEVARKVDHIADRVLKEGLVTWRYWNRYTLTTIITVIIVYVSHQFDVRRNDCLLNFSNKEDCWIFKIVSEVSVILSLFGLIILFFYALREIQKNSLVRESEVQPSCINRDRPTLEYIDKYGDPCNLNALLEFAKNRQKMPRIDVLRN